MEKLNINCPEGYVIDEEKSNLSKGEVYFKKIDKKLSYSDVAEKLFCKEDSYYTSDIGRIYHLGAAGTSYMNQNYSKTVDQLESILALNKLCNVAKYLNGNWLPKIGQSGAFILYTGEYLDIKSHNSVKYGMIYFKSEELAEQAIEILGEEEIRKALTLNH